MSTFQKHLEAVQSGTVTKSNVIGIRKALNAESACSFSYAIAADSYSEGDTPCDWKDAGLRLANIAEAMHGAREVTS